MWIERIRRLLAKIIARRPRARLLAFMEDEIWSQIPPELMDRPITKEEEEEILGYGEEGV